ncbi:pyridoxamine 5'-phosphate oxidase [Rubrobacter aplysinae]|uniref:pyridoxamine 5'-phosphate oxidase n=1 Tax=Rubrobacter aplysinae TaxID=909625 RepID=UPI00064BFFAB|nr:pyridoxamine 5'-phosphate oxidase [Rubrobacter aplysinae]
MEDSVARLRREYTRTGLSENEAQPDPVEQFRRWFEAALEAGLHEPNAMTLATADSSGAPSARIVLLKGYDEHGFVFYTSYTGRKAAELEENPRAALVFYWGKLERQVRVEGEVSRLLAEESDAYFASRPWGSRIGAHVSEQSRPIDSRAALERRQRELEERYAGREVPRPAGWGGYRLAPQRVEFWQGRESRLHDRLLYTPDDSGGWEITRLQP